MTVGAAIDCVQGRAKQGPVPALTPGSDRTSEARCSRAQSIAAPTEGMTVFGVNVH